MEKRERRSKIIPIILRLLGRISSGEEGEGIKILKMGEEKISSCGELYTTLKSSPGCPWALTSLTMVAPWGMGLPGPVWTILVPPTPAIDMLPVPLGTVATYKLVYHLLSQSSEHNPTNQNRGREKGIVSFTLYLFE